MTGTRTPARVFATMEATLPGRGQDIKEIVECASWVSAVLPQCDDLRLKPWRGDPDPVRGHCYVASESLWWAVGDWRRHMTPMTVRHEGTVHWWLSLGDARLDLTSAQFSAPVPYELGRGRGFLTKVPSNRAHSMMSRAFRQAAQNDIGMLEACTGRRIEIRVDGFRDQEGKAYLRAVVVAGVHGIMLRTDKGFRDLLCRFSIHADRVRNDLAGEVLDG